MLREGTPVSLISIEELSSRTAEGAQPIALVLASDLQIDGVTVARAGTKASGQAIYTNAPNGEGAAVNVRLQQVRLKVGDMEVPLRSTQLRKGGSEVAYHRLEGSERIAVVLYTAANTALAPAP